MKKACFLLILILLLCCTSCAEMHDLLYETEQSGITYCVRGNGTRVKQIVVKNGNRVIWSKAIETDSTVGNLDGCYGLGVADLNFDGYDDVMIATAVDGDLISYACFLRDGEKEDFDYSAELSALSTIGVNYSLEAIFGFTQERETLSDGHYSLCDQATKYIWNGGKLLPEMYASITYNSKIDTYRYSVAYYDEELNRFEDSSDIWMTPEEYAGADMSFLYYFK
ncbi:MAG: hypothetical protein IJX80_04930 [Clostridia bacterium]|nr:hypothetical protein [Clostridia bacterium]